MEGAAVLGRLSWHVADVAAIVPETQRVSSIVLDCPAWPGHAAGQHVDVRLTDGGADVRFTLTREQPEGWTGYARRIDADLLQELSWAPAERPLVYACGPNGFVETAANTLVELGHEPGLIHTERFGPTG